MIPNKEEKQVFMSGGSFDFKRFDILQCAKREHMEIISSNCQRSSGHVPHSSLRYRNSWHTTWNFEIQKIRSAF